MTSKSRGESDAAVLLAAADAATFALCRKRLERAISAACTPDRQWPARVAAGIEAALRFADADSTATRVLTTQAAFRGRHGAQAFEEMVDRFADLFRRGAPPTSHPDRTARTIVVRIARQTLLQLERRPDARATEIAPDLIVFALIPYLGFAEAQRWAS